MSYVKCQEDCNELYIEETKAPLAKWMAQHRKALFQVVNRSGYTSNEIVRGVLNFSKFCFPFSITQNTKFHNLGIYFCFLCIVLPPFKNNTHKPHFLLHGATLTQLLHTNIPRGSSSPLLGYKTMKHTQHDLKDYNMKEGTTALASHLIHSSITQL